VPFPLGDARLDAIAIAVAAVLGALFSGLTTALNELTDERLMAVRDEGGPEADTARRVLEKTTRIRSRLLTGRILAVAAVSGFTAHLAASSGITDWPILGAVFGAALVYAIGVEATQTIVRGRETRTVLRFLRVARPFELLLAPFAWPIELVSQVTNRLVAPSEQAVPESIAEREVEHLIEKHEEEGALPEQNAEMLLNVLEFKDTLAREVMVPRTRMVALGIDTPLEELVKRVTEEGHSRYPVYADKIDKIEGVLYAKDLFAAIRSGAQPSLRKLLRKQILFTAETTKIGQLLRDMQSRRQHMAIVIDEFGGTSGIVTLEDILEEIVGEIHDEHDTPEQLLTELGPGRFLADARVSIHDLDDALDGAVGRAGQGDFDSLGGLVVDLAGKVPPVGAELSLAGLDLIVREADTKSVQRVEIRRRDSIRPPQSVPEESSAEG
jgi:CBS domain containing-hemolysin-like protein